jgi:hypothetical protein
MERAVSLRDVLREHPLTTFEMPELSEIALQFAMNTPFHNRLVVNSPVLPGTIGIFDAWLSRALSMARAA